LDKGYKDIVFQQSKAPRTIKNIAQDVNTLIGKRGSIGDKDLSFEQKVALKRLSSDLKTIKRNAKRVGKTVEEYLADTKVDPKVAALLGQKSSVLEKYAGSINLERQDIPKEFKEFETQIQNPKKKQPVILENKTHQ